MATDNYSGKKAKDIMRRDIITVKEDTLLSQVSKIFAENPFRHLPVVEKGEIIGVVSRKDITDKLLTI